ncbi:MAG: hypothetical protein IKJ34_01585 [Mailhella sp.]|nr:hypothetical protein [Mailhella sp.]
MDTRSPFFDSQDYEFLAMISQTVVKNGKVSSRLRPHLSPNGIVELAEPVELRMAASVLRLLDSLEQGKANDRLEALSVLHDEVLFMSRTSLRINTGRVLIHLMKELVRARGDFETQLRLAHDFRQAATGRHTVVRRLLHRYHLLEMPETWNQAVFDNHVHDANTKGRKNATHLIMDAWLKGIRSLTVIYYNYVSPEAARELLRAAEIMDISVRIGLLFHAPHRGHLVDLIWIPRGFANAEEFLSFLSSPSISTLMNEGRAATRWLERRILSILEIWNDTERQRLAPMLGGEPQELSLREFISFVGSGQASLLHLAEFIHRKIFPLMKAQAHSLQAILLDPESSEEQKQNASADLEKLDTFTTETILARLNDPQICPESAYLQHSCDATDCPELLNQPPAKLLARLNALRSGCRVTLNLAKLSAEDVLDLLWDCQGRITHLELFNLKDWQNGDLAPIKQINELQRAINDGSVPRLKQLILAMLQEGSPSDPLQDQENMEEYFSSSTVKESARTRKLRIILQNIPVLCGYYQTVKLRATFGTDSTSRPGPRYGMGLAYPETLPLRARRELDDPRRSAHLLLPLRTELLEQVTYTSHMPGEELSPFISFIRRLPGLRHFGQQQQTEWIPVSENTIVCNDGHCSIATGDDSLQGNIVTLGGTDKTSSNGFRQKKEEKISFTEKLHYLNSSLANGLRFFIGFIPAFLTFLMTQSGNMAWLGAPLWFLISAVRNIVQSVLGNGGLHRSSLLHWKSYVVWPSVYVSLMFNGLSVILLEWLLRIRLLDQEFGMDILNAPVATYATLGVAFGLFKMFTHVLRGFSTRSLLVDALCTLLSLPLMVVFHHILVSVAGAMGHEAATLVPFTVFVVKLASDTAVGFADGMADRERNLRLRMNDYHTRLKSALALYSRLEAMFPENNVLNMLTHPAALLDKLEKRDPQFRLALIINALDLMYFWFYQPRANYALKRHLRRFSPSERIVLLRMQEVLRLEKLISQLLVHGLLGDSFAAPLSFYVANCENYLRQMNEVCLDSKID